MNLNKLEKELEEKMYELIKARDKIRIVINEMCEAEENATEHIKFIEEFLNEDWRKN